MLVKGLFLKQHPKHNSIRVMEGHAFLIILILSVLHRSIICFEVILQ